MRTATKVLPAMVAIAIGALPLLGCLTPHAVRFDHAAQAQDKSAAGCPTSVVDVDGHRYKTVLIGAQCWLADNLRVGRYRDGEPIADEHLAVIDLATYGRLYRWAAVADPRGLCPEGWHVPSDDDYQTLELAVGMAPAAAGDTGWRGVAAQSRQLKQFDVAREWPPEAQAQVNRSGFSALPGGGSSGFITTADGVYGDFWTSTELSDDRAWFRQLTWLSVHPHRERIRRADAPKGQGCSVRCLLGGGAVRDR